MGATPLATRPPPLPSSSANNNLASEWIPSTKQFSDKLVKRRKIFPFFSGISRKGFSFSKVAVFLNNFNKRPKFSDFLREQIIEISEILIRGRKFCTIPWSISQYPDNKPSIKTTRFQPQGTNVHNHLFHSLRPKSGLLTPLHSVIG